MNLVKSKSATIFFHLMTWLVLFCLPYLLSSGQNQEVKNVLVFSWTPMFFFAILFYINYFLLIERFLFQKKTVLYILINCSLIALLILINTELKDAFFSQVFKNGNDNFHRPPRKFFIYIDIISFIVPVIFSLALKTIERWIKTEAERKEAANIKLQSELQHLKYQLQPHFFFNSLNNIYSLVDFSPEMAKQTIHSLGKLMRYLLYETNNEKVSLQKEIIFMTNYIELMKLRLTDNTKVTYSFPDLKEDLLIAPLLFISLIENAFKHGVSADKSTEIIFKLTVTDNNVVFYSENFNFPKSEMDKSGSGIGLDNLEKRLALLFPGKHSFVEQIVDDKFVVSLKLEV